MRKIEDTGQESRYACVFGKTGLERQIARAIERNFPGLTARAVVQVKHQSRNGVKSLVEAVSLPGYVFIAVPPDCGHINLYDCARVPDVFRLLTDSEGDWTLRGSDRDFARWAIDHDGLIGLSQACRIGDRVRLLSGPLKELEGYVVKIDRRGRNGQIEISLNGQTRRLWLAFEYTQIKVL